jgi:hypothetical protein
MDDKKDQINTEQVSDQYDELFNATSVMFFAKLKAIKPFAKKVGLGGFVRALRYALMASITEKNIELKNEKEKDLAYLLAQIIDHHTIVRGGIMKKLDQEKINKEEK